MDRLGFSLYHFPPKGFGPISFLYTGVEATINKWGKKGYKLMGQSPIINNQGKTTHFSLTFSKETMVEISPHVVTQLAEKWI
jgi:hypothetical protein